jgi:hypothetical protein
MVLERAISRIMATGIIRGKVLRPHFRSDAVTGILKKITG